jgi:hypothetical protein
MADPHPPRKKHVHMYAVWGYSITNFTTVLLLFLTKKSWLKVDSGKGFAQPNLSQGGYTYTMAKPVCQLLIFPFLTLVRTP